MKLFTYIALLLVLIEWALIVQTTHDIVKLQEIKRIDYSQKKHWVKSDIIEMLSYKAIENNIQPKYLIKLAECESSLIPDIQSNYIQSYGRELSFGLFQLHVKVHKDISIEQAKDPIFNTQWAINEIKKGKAPQHWVHCNKVAKRVL